MNSAVIDMFFDTLYRLNRPIIVGISTTTILTHPYPTIYAGRNTGRHHKPDIFNKVLVPKAFSSYNFQCGSLLRILIRKTIQRYIQPAFQGAYDDFFAPDFSLCRHQPCYAGDTVVRY